MDCGNGESRVRETLMKKLRASEPARFVNKVKTCPRPLCGSEQTSWRYYNNGKLSQPRYLCNRCKREFTLGGRIRISHEELTAVTRMREEAAAKALKDALKPGNLTPVQEAAYKAASKKSEATRAAKKAKVALEEKEQTSNFQMEIGGASAVQEQTAKPKYKSVRFDL